MNIKCQEIKPHRSKLAMGLGIVSLVLAGGCQNAPEEKKAASIWDAPAVVEKPELSPNYKETPVLPATNWRKIHSEVWYTDNARVQKWKNTYRKSRDPWKLWDKSTEYRPIIQEIFAAHQLPNELCMLPMLESSFRTDARSSSNATGLWQFTKETGEELGLVMNNRIDERLNWKRSTEAASNYLTQLAQKFNGDWALVLAAYNMGPGALERAMAEQGVSNYWQLKLRPETMEYVPRFLAMLQLLRETYPRP